MNPRTSRGSYLSVLLVSALLPCGALAAQRAQSPAGQTRLGTPVPGLAPAFPGQSLRLGPMPARVMLADLDGDGDLDLDLATINAQGPTFSVALDQGASGFAAASDYDAGTPASALAVGDLDGDGRPDLAATLRDETGGVAVALNQGNGSFAVPVVYTVGASTPRTACAVAIGDVDGNGSPDLAVAMSYVTHTVMGDLSDPRAVVLANSGTGTFVQQSEEVVGAPLGFAFEGLPSLALADLDGSGTLDMVLSIPNQTELSVLLGQGGGAFAPQVHVHVSQTPFALLARDLDGDGDADVAFVNGIGGVTALANTGGGFGAETNLATATNTKDLTSGDVDGDGDPDLVLAGIETVHFSGRVHVLLNQGSGTFAAPIGTECPSPFGLALGDLDGNGSPDVAATNGATVFLLPNAGAGHFTPQPHASLAVGAHPDHLTSADLDGDGTIDLVTGGATVNEIGVLLGQGGGSFAPIVRYGPGIRVVATVVADLNGDGIPDLAAAGASSLAGMQFGNGDGSFAPQIGLAAGGVQSGLVARDLDHDGDLDLVFALPNADSGSALANLGTGTFAAPVTFSTGGDQPKGLTAADFDGDGDVDLAFANGGDSTASVLLGLGNGTFGAPTTFVAGLFPVAITSADLDRDGDADLALAISYTGDASVLPGDGAGGFAPRSTYELGGVAGMTIGEANADGFRDLVFVGNESIELLLNRQDASFAPYFECGAGPEPMAVRLADLDGDGDADLAVGEQTEGVVRLILNQVR